MSKARLKRLEAAFHQPEVCSCWGVVWIEHEEGEPEPTLPPCPVCHGRNAPPADTIRFIVVPRPGTQ